MKLNAALSFAALCFMVVLLITYLSKKNVSGGRTTTYIIYLVLSLLFTLSDLLIIPAHKYVGESLGKVVFIFHWSSCVFTFYAFYLYVSYVTYRMNEKNIFKIMTHNLVMTVVLIITIVEQLIYIFVLPYDAFSLETCNFVPGISTLVNGCTTLMFAFLFLLSSYKYRNELTDLETKGFIFPVICSIVCFVLQLTYTYYSIVPFATVLTAYYLYFNSENPEILMTKDMANLKKSSEDVNKSKTYLLNSVSDKISIPFKTISDVANKANKTQSMKEYKELMASLKEPTVDALNILDIKLSLTNMLSVDSENKNVEYGVKDLIDHIVTNTNKELAKKDVRLYTKVAENVPSILLGNISKLEIILTNLINNSINYTEYGKIILTVGGTSTDNKITELSIKIMDTGLGMTKEEQEELLSGKTSNGISISNELITSLGGKLEIVSEKNVGSEFHILLKQQIVNLTPIGSYIAPGTSDISAIKYIDCTGMKVLICDDNNLSIDLLSYHLKKYNFEIDGISKTDEAINNVKTTNYDLIFVDDLMSEMSGTSLLQKIKKINPNVPVVIYTANAILGMKEKYLNSGFDNYLSKPIDAGELNQIIASTVFKK